MKKLKHKMVEKMKDSTADTLGITRAVLVNGKSLGVIICDQNITKSDFIPQNYKYRLDTVFEVSTCNRTTVYLLRVEPEVITVSKVVLLCVETKNTVSKQFRL